MGGKLHPHILNCKAVHFKSTIDNFLMHSFLVRITALFITWLLCAGDQIQVLWRFTTTQRGCKVFWNSWKQSWWDKFFQIGQFKIPLLTSWHHVFYNLIELFWEWSWPHNCDKKISQSVIAKTSHTVQLNGETRMIWKGEWYNLKGYCRVYHWSTNS